MQVFQVRLDERERQSYVKEVGVSSLSPFIRTGGKFWLRLQPVSSCIG